jgi:F-type H+-transporting ATPase subunit epsilon
MFVLNLVTPERKLVTNEEVEEVIVPGEEGQMDILPGHAPLVGTLGTGVLRYRLRGETKFTPVVVSWGYISIHQNGLSILAETADSIEEIDRKKAEEAARLAQQNLVDPYIDMDQIEKFQRDLARAEAQIEALNH